MTGRRSFFRSLLALPPVAVVAAELGHADVVAPASASFPEGLQHRIIRAALERIGRLVPGEWPSESEIDSGRFHLDGMMQERAWRSSSEAALELASRLNTVPSIALKWYGTPLDEVPPAEAWLASAGRYSFADECWALPFFSGEQWERHTLKEREDAGRPTLVLNRLPGIVAIAVAKSRLSGWNDLHRAGELQDLYVAVTVPNADAQRLYNYTGSALAEEIRSRRK